MKTTRIRQLASVMFADIVGYTSLMQKNEAVKVRRKHRRIFEKQHQLYNGEIIQYYVDGVLSIFKSANESVKCAIEIQRLL